VTLAERWNGVSWSIQDTPALGFSALSGVSCRSTTACTAVGSFINGNTLVTLAARWDGASWSVQSTPNPAGGAQRAERRVVRVDDGVRGRRVLHQ
jgi:hypothetical protein